MVQSLFITSLAKCRSNAHHELFLIVRGRRYHHRDHHLITSSPSSLLGRSLYHSFKGLFEVETTQV